MKKISILALITLILMFIISSVVFAITVREGEKVRVVPKVFDPDGDKVKVYYSYPLDENGEWQTKRGDAGNYTCLITVTDGELATKQEVNITVLSINNPPSLDVPEVITVKEGEDVFIPIRISDKDNDRVVYSISGWMSSERYITNYDDAGEYQVKVSASDGYDVVEKNIKIIVKDNNRLPIIEAEPIIKVAEGEALKINYKVSDPDGDDVRVYFTGWMNSSEKNITFDDQGEHLVIIKANDGKDIAQKEIKIIVQNVDKAPEIRMEKTSFYVREGEKIEIPFGYIDPDGDFVTTSAYGLPEGAKLESHSIIYIPDYAIANNTDPKKLYIITLIARSNNLNATKQINLTVENLNRKPVIMSYSGENSYYVNTRVPLFINATDADGDPLYVKWNFGLFESYSTGLSHDRIFTKPGKKKVVATVSDGKDEVSAIWKINILDDSTQQKIIAFEKKYVQYIIEQPIEEKNVIVLYNK